MLRLSAFACLAAMTAALVVQMPMRASRPLIRVQRSRELVAHLLHGWAPKVDPASGATYYYNAQTGQVQWEPPTAATAQQFYGEQVEWVVEGTFGAYDTYIVRNGQEQALGRYDMTVHNPHLSEVQCLVRVADGAASLISRGETPTALRAPGGAWNHQN